SGAGGLHRSATMVERNCVGGGTGPSGSFGVGSPGSVKTILPRATLVPDFQAQPCSESSWAEIQSGNGKASSEPHWISVTSTELLFGGWANAPPSGSFKTVGSWMR